MSEHSDAQARCRAYLAELGESSEDVAKKLTEMGIKGGLMNACQCPITNYLLSKGLFYVGTCFSSVCFAVTNAGKGEFFKVETSRAVRHFVEDFDRKKYPDLIESPKLETCGATYDHSK